MYEYLSYKNEKTVIFITDSTKSSVAAIDHIIIGDSEVQNRTSFNVIL